MVARPNDTDELEPQKLPPGRHGLSRAFVVKNQRERILAAVADVASAAGYVEMSVEDVIVTAGLSRRTFYEHFKNKEDAFLAAYDAVAERLLRSVREAYEPERTFADRLRAGLQAFLELLSREPTFARMCIVEALAAGPEAVKRRNAAMKELGAMIEESARELGTTLDPPELTAETIVGGIYEVVYSRVVRGEIRELSALLPDLLYTSLLPYAGQEGAIAEYQRLKRMDGSRRP